MEKSPKNTEIVYDLLGFIDKKPVMQIKKIPLAKPTVQTKPSVEPKLVTQTTNKAIGKFVILKNQHIKKVCTPINLKNLRKLPPADAVNIDVKNMVAWSKLVTKVDAVQRVTKTDHKLLRTYSKKFDKSYQGSVNSDNGVGDNVRKAGTLPVCNSGNFDEGVSSMLDDEVKLSSDVAVEGTEDGGLIKDSVDCRSEGKLCDIVENSVIGDQQSPKNPVPEGVEMGKIKHFKEKTQQQDAQTTSIGKNMLEEPEKMDVTNTKTEIDKSTNPTTQNRPRKQRIKPKNNTSKREMIRREVEKCLKLQTIRKNRRKRVREARQRHISCQTSENTTQTISTQTELEVVNTQTTDENLDLLQLNEIIEQNIGGVLTRDVNFGSGPTMPGVTFAGKNAAGGGLCLGNTPLHQSGALQDYFAQLATSGAPGNVCFDLLIGGNVGNAMVADGGGADSGKVMFYNYLRRCDQCDAGGNIPLHIAVMASDIAEVRRQCVVLGLRRKSVDVPNATGLTPLHVAVLNACSVDLIDVLLQHGADPLAMDNDGNTSLHLAVTCHSQPVLVHLLKTVKTSDQNVDVFNYEGFTPLMLSVLEDSYPLVHECIIYGANPNTKDQKSGRTSLFHAVENNNEDMVKLFIINGANTKIKNFFGTSTHEATFELENIKPEIKNLVVGKDSCPNRVNRAEKKKKKPLTTGDKFPEMKNKLKTVRVLKVIKVNGKPQSIG